MAEKVTIMVLKVDLLCYRCYKKVKKVLSRFPQIRDQIYDEKANTVTITVVCCSPEKIRDKICYKGGGSIKSIEIKPPPKPKEPEKKPEKPKEPEKKSEKPKEPEKKLEKPKEPPPKPLAPKPSESAPTPPVVYPPIGFCFPECYNGHGGGPCYFGGTPPIPRPSYETYGRPVYDSWGGGGGGTGAGSYSYVSYSGGGCFSEENPQACSVM
ncbi:hypothetical protein CRYUN_Cryun37aG0134700 [Craigia yunnanensis]